MADKYIGIENELTSFNEENEKIDFGDYFYRFVNDSDYKKSRSSIRTTTGNGFYVDGNEIEILTPPILINKGFATRLTESLMIGRNRVVKSIPELKHTGYSMHWNLTQSSFDNITSTGFYKGVVVPFHLFGLTPISIGSGMRVKPNRFELLGDSINNEEQINALGLMLGAYNYASDKKNNYSNSQDSIFVKSIAQEYLNFEQLKARIFLSKRSDNFKTSTQESIQAQQYLEMFYKWIEPFVSALGTKKEVQNLEDFIEARKPLEFDKFKYYDCLNEMGFKENVIYWTNELFKNTVLSETRERKVPLEGRLLGGIVKQMKDKINSINWDALELGVGEFCTGCDRYHQIITIRQIDGVYRFAEDLNKKMPGLKRVYLDVIKPALPNFQEFLSQNRTFSEDNSLDLPEEEIRNFFRGIDNDYECQIQLGRFGSYYNNENRKAEDIVCKECDKICYNKKKITKKGKN
ncbi:MAG: hypothetical protein Q7S33_01695 [Nanoarchaeota archaeon]|nr:hypothetical protein [Nanoarchaeota archaeon]